MTARAGWPSSAALIEARQSVVVAYRAKGLGTDRAEDIAQEAIATALQDFDPERGSFHAYVTVIARRVAVTAHYQQEHVGGRKRRARAAPQPARDDWAPLIPKLSPSRFAAWHAMLCRTSAPSRAVVGPDGTVERIEPDLLDYVELFAIKILGLRSDLATLEVQREARAAALQRISEGLEPEPPAPVPPSTESWEEEFNSITELALRQLLVLPENAYPLSRDVVLRAVLHAAGVRGEAFSPWLDAVRDRRKKDARQDERGHRVPAQVMTLWEFGDQRLEFGDGLHATAEQLNREYGSFCRARGESPISEIQLGGILSATHGVHREHTEGGTRYAGLRVKK